MNERETEIERIAKEHHYLLTQHMRLALREAMDWQLEKVIATINATGKVPYSPVLRDLLAELRQMSHNGSVAL